MTFIDIAVFFLCLSVLIYLLIDRRKYLDINAYYKKVERSMEINLLIYNIEIKNKEILDQIISADIDMLCDDNFSDKLIKFRDDEDKLKELKNEQREIQTYIRNARHYKNTIGI